MRLASPSDIDRLLPVYQSCFPVHAVFDKDHEFIRSYLMRSLAHGHRFIFKDIEGKVAGAVMVRKKGGNGTHGLFRINHLAVLPEFRGKGLGSALVVEAENVLRSLQFDSIKIELQFIADKEGLLGFYQKLGYRKEGVLSSHFRPGEDVIVMGKELVP